MKSSLTLVGPLSWDPTGRVRGAWQKPARARPAKTPSCLENKGAVCMVASPLDRGPRKERRGSSQRTRSTGGGPWPTLHGSRRLTLSCAAPSLNASGRGCSHSRCCLTGGYWSGPRIVECDPWCTGHGSIGSVGSRQDFRLNHKNII